MSFGFPRYVTVPRLVLLVVICVVPLLIAATGYSEERAVCAVCGPREGAGFEPVKAKATYQGREYFFCSLKCKVEFLKNPTEFLQLAEGSPAPAFELSDLSGRMVRLSDYRGSVVLLDFWAAFCWPCVKALPRLEDLQQQYEQRGLRVIGISVDDRLELVHKAISKAGVTYPILRGTSEIWNSYKVNALPSLILVDRQGRMVRRFGGEADRDLMRKTIEQALAQ